MAVLVEEFSAAHTKKMAGGYPSTGSSSLPVATLSASDRWRSLGGSEGAPRQLAEGCRWVGGAENVEMDGKLLQQGTEASEAGKILDLNLHFKFIKEISGLDQIAPNLRMLDLSSNNIRVMQGLEGMSKLRELKLYGCQISRIQNLEHCVSLMSLHLEDNNISSIEGLDSVRCLEYLNLDSNRIQKIGKGLGRLMRLKELHLSRNQLTSLDGLAGLANLEVCSLEHNRLSKVTSEQVKGLGKLDELKISGNQISSLSFLVAGVSKPTPSLPSLVQLDASANRLNTTSFRGLEVLPQLAELNLSSNQIEEIAPCFVETFPILEILDLSNNLLHRGKEDLTQLKEISSLRELLLNANPMMAQSDSEEMQEALSGLDCLEFLDDQAVEKKPEVNILSIEQGTEDTDTFPLTVTTTLTDGPEAKRPGSSSSSSRPATASSRPGTAQKMAEAGVKDPLMHMKAHKLSDKRFASEEQVVHWEKQTLNGLLAVQKQIDKISHHIDSDLSDMNRFLNKADKLLEKEKELARKRPTSADDPDGQVPTLKPAASIPSESPAPRWDSKTRSRLQEAVDRGREDGEEEEETTASGGLQIEADSLPISPTSSPSRLSPAHAMVAACDEEISEDEPILEPSPAPSTPEPAEEVEEDVRPEETLPVLNGLGPRAARAAAVAEAVVAAGGRSPGGRDPKLHVDARAKDRGGGPLRPSSRESRGKVGVQQAQGPRVKPPVAPPRTSVRTPK